MPSDHTTCDRDLIGQFAVPFLAPQLNHLKLNREFRSDDTVSYQGS